MKPVQFTIKQLDKLSKKAEKASSDERIKVKKALEKGDKGSAQIYAENAIRKRNESLNFLRLSARVDAVSSRVQTALTMKSVVRGIDQVTKDLERAMSSFELEKVSQIMSKFEKQFEDLDVKSSVSHSGTSMCPFFFFQFFENSTVKFREFPSIADCGECDGLGCDHHDAGGGCNESDQASGGRERPVGGGATGCVASCGRLSGRWFASRGFQFQTAGRADQTPCAAAQLTMSHYTALLQCSPFIRSSHLLVCCVDVYNVQVTY